MIGKEKLIEAARQLSNDKTINKVAVVLPPGAIGEQIAATALGGLAGGVDGFNGANWGTAIGEFGTRAVQDLTHKFPAYILAASPQKLYLLGLHDQGMMHHTKDMQLVQSWERDKISVTDLQDGVSHHVTITSQDGSSVTLEAKMLNSGLPEMLKLLGSVRQ